MKVDYVDHMGSDLSVVNAARVSFDKESDWEYNLNDAGVELSEKRLDNRDQKLIKYLAEHNHWSPFAHTAVSLRVKAPIFIARQLAKHQVGGAWNEVSRRYVDSDPEFYLPEKWRAKADSVKQGSGGELKIDDVGDTKNYLDENTEDLNSFCKGYYNWLLHEGVCPEQARMVLPQSMYTEWIWTGSLYFFTNVYNLRSDPHAQKEVQEVAEIIKEVVEPLYPVSWKELTKCAQ